MESIFFIIVLLFSIVIHEVSHGGVANLFGDSTAKYAGRLTLNPIKHLDPIGSILLPLFLLLLTAGRGPIFGWAKPVPINPYNLKNPKRDSALVALAGPASNFLVALTFGLGIRFLSLSIPLVTFFSIIVILNLILALFNLFPVPPLDGAHILFTLLPESCWKLKATLEQYGLFILIFFLFLAIPLLFRAATFLFYLIVGQPFII